MRIRAAVMGFGIAIVALTGLSAPAQADTRIAVQNGTEFTAATTTYGWYRTYGQCVDAGQQLVREHAIRNFSCDYDAGHSPSYQLKGW
ncbi:hypothetical protein [Nocardia sp. NPDC052566]|uniref:hypothetical protein n=1 Tax=Nocardia sp. NPDC052566 TaxID=3364330 RepID=UPI0037C62344